MLSELNKKIALIENNVKDLIEKLELSEKINLMCQYQDAVPRLNINKYKHGTESAHGMAWLGKATMFPQTIGLASSWDKELLYRIGEVIGTEARGFFARDKEMNGLTLWAPTVDMNRDPRWGRSEESYGEDPLLAGRLACEYVRGIQGDHPLYYRCGATLKHFYGNNNEKNRGSCSTDISEKIKREYYLRVFQIIVEEAAPLSMMTAYNEINGMPANVHPDLQKIVRNEWGWPGFVVSDAGDVLSLIKEHKYVETPKEALAATIKAGVDSITDDHEVSKKAIADALREELLSENDLNKALERCFRIRYLLGEFAEPGECPYEAIDDSLIGSDKHGEVAYDAAVRSMVLLKNDEGILPLDNPETNIALIGNLSDRIYRDWYSGEFLSRSIPSESFSEWYSNTSVCAANDHIKVKHKISGLYLNDDGTFSEEGSVLELEDWGWNAHTFRSLETGKYLTCGDESISCTADEIFGWFTKEVFYLDSRREDSVEIKTWNTASALFKDNRLVTLEQAGEEGEIGISASTPEGFVETGSGDFILEKVKDGREEALEIAENCDIPIVMIGNHPLINGKETVDRFSLDLPERQYDLAKSIVKCNPNAVLCIIGSYPFALKDLKEFYTSIIYTSHSGQAAGEAIRDIINGTKNPSGRLPLTWYSSADDLGDIMDYEIENSGKTYLYHQGDCDFPFGTGLSYTSFIYSDFKAGKDIISRQDKKLTFQVEIHNTGDRAGAEVVQLYSSFCDSRYKRSLRQLMDFAKVELDPGEIKNIELTIRNSDLMVWDEEKDSFEWEPVKVNFYLGNSSCDPIKSLEINLK